MPLTKGSDLRGLSVDELKQKKESLEKDLNELRQKKITGQLDKPHQFKLMRRQIAQISTLEKEKKNADTSRKK
jgi:large subunit ribosomal protein L29